MGKDLRKDDSEDINEILNRTNMGKYWNTLRENT